MVRGQASRLLHRLPADRDRPQHAYAEEYRALRIFVPLSLYCANQVRCALRPIGLPYGFLQTHRCSDDLCLQIVFPRFGVTPLAFQVDGFAGFAGQPNKRPSRVSENATNHPDVLIYSICEKVLVTTPRGQRQQSLGNSSGMCLCDVGSRGVIECSMRTGARCRRISSARQKVLTHCAASREQLPSR